MLSVVAALLIAMPTYASSIGTGLGFDATALCQGFISQTVLNNGGGQISAVNGMLDVSLLLILLMINIAAVLYLVGSAIKLPQLSNFGKAEIGEIIVTVLIVFIFLGGFQYENSLPTTGSYLALAPGVVSQGIFQSDCTSLAGGSLTALSSDILPLAIEMDLVQFASSINFGATVTYEGLLEARPFAGLVFAQQLFGKALTIVIALIGLPLAGAAILAIFYAIAPLFLYLGIILRTIPFTRAAGGSFLGMFVSFYILFPLLLYLFIANVSLATTTVQYVSIQQTLNSILPGAGGLNFGSSGIRAITAVFGALGAVQAIILAVVGQMLYLVISLVLSLMISFDFMERAGDLLGAPSLSSQHTLRKII